MIIKKDRSVLNQIDRIGNTPIYLATTMLVMSSGRDKEDKASEVLQIILDHQFPGPIDNASQEDFKELFLTKKLLKEFIQRKKAPFILSV